MANFLTINKVSGRLRFIDNNGNVSLVAKSGTPLFLSIRDPFLKAVVPLHLQVQVKALSKEKTMYPNMIARTAFLSFEEFKVYTSLANDPPQRAYRSPGNICLWWPRRDTRCTAVP